MNYKLAKELKDAGFPQKSEPVIQQEVGIMYTEPCYLPSLSELIEACEPGKGDEFYLRICHEWEAGYIYHGYFEGWNNMPREKDGYVDIDVKETGGTPEEAVAKLWLRLHGKESFFQRK